MAVRTMPATRSSGSHDTLVRARHPEPRGSGARLRPTSTLPYHPSHCGPAGEHDGRAPDPVTNLGPDSGGRLARPGLGQGLHLGVGTGRVASARPAVDRDLPRRVRRSCCSSSRPTRRPAGPGSALRPGDGPGVPHQVGHRSRHRLALRRRDHHGTRRAGRAQRGRHRRRRPRDVLLRGRVPVHRARSVPSAAAAGAGSSGSAACWP